MQNLGLIIALAITGALGGITLAAMDYELQGCKAELREAVQ